MPPSTVERPLCLAQYAAEPIISPNFRHPGSKDSKSHFSRLFGSFHSSRCVKRSPYSVMTRSTKSAKSPRRLGGLLHEWPSEMDGGVCQIDSKMSKSASAFIC